jgi:hypothetical protein
VVATVLSAGSGTLLSVGPGTVAAAGVSGGVNSHSGRAAPAPVPFARAHAMSSTRLCGRVREASRR